MALLNLAMSDGLATSMETKYHYTVWRPETAIRAGDADGNDRTVGRADFAPFIATPCFRANRRPMRARAYAARWILERTWEGADFSVTLSHPAVAGVAVTYTTLKQLTDDIDDARVDGGIHFQFDQEAGGVQGHRIANYVLGHVLGDMDEYSACLRVIGRGSWPGNFSGWGRGLQSSGVRALVPPPDLAP